MQMDASKVETCSLCTHGECVFADRQRFWNLLSAVYLLKADLYDWHSKIDSISPPLLGIFFSVILCKVTLRYLLNFTQFHLISPNQIVNNSAFCLRNQLDTYWNDTISLPLEELWIYLIHKLSRWPQGQWCSALAAIWLYLLVTYVTTLKSSVSPEKVVKFLTTLVLGVSNNVFSSITAVPITSHPPNNPYSLDACKITTLQLTSLCEGVCVHVCMGVCVFAYLFVCLRERKR